MPGWGILPRDVANLAACVFVTSKPASPGYFQYASSLYDVLPRPLDASGMEHGQDDIPHPGEGCRPVQRDRRHYAVQADRSSIGIVAYAIVKAARGLICGGESRARFAEADGSGEAIVNEVCGASCDCRVGNTKCS